ncbi:putative uncharacterized protein DDB_G0271982 [Penaeus indicus]|uniref:putative uncharacterized protein DDB_G0271982 n=1 Tax=Penaeus indicus TaxID=29960 RepID=UPI00300D45C5
MTSSSSLLTSPVHCKQTCAYLNKNSMSGARKTEALEEAESCVSSLEDPKTITEDDRKNKSSKTENRDKREEIEEDREEEEEADEEDEAEIRESFANPGSISGVEASPEYRASSTLLSVENLRGKPLLDTQIWVNAGNRYLLPVNLNSGVTLRWCFSAEPKSVCFAILHQPEAEEKFNGAKNDQERHQERDRERDREQDRERDRERGQERNQERHQLRDQENDQPPASSSTFPSIAPSSSTLPPSSSTSSTSTSSTSLHRVLIPTTRVASAQGTARKGKLSTKQPAVYTFLFDNSYARLV